MMITFGESGHPVVRATSPFSRGTLKRRGGGKLSIHFCADGDSIETVFRTIISVISSVSTEQSQMCVRNTVLVKQEQGDLLWQSNLIHFSRQQTTFGESGHPVVRATSPFSRGTLKRRGGGKLSIHFCADGDSIETVFRTIISVISSVSTEQSQMCVRNTVLVKQEQGDLLWQSNLIHFSRQQTY